MLVEEETAYFVLTERLDTFDPFMIKSARHTRLTISVSISESAGLLVTYLASQGNVESSNRYVGGVGEHVFKGDNALSNYRSLTHFTCIQNAASPYPTKCHNNLYNFPCGDKES